MENKYDTIQVTFIIAVDLKHLSISSVIHSLNCFYRLLMKRAATTYQACLILFAKLVCRLRVWVPDILGTLVRLPRSLDDFVSNVRCTKCGKSASRCRLKWLSCHYRHKTTCKWHIHFLVTIIQKRHQKTWLGSDSLEFSTNLTPHNLYQIHHLLWGSDIWRWLQGCRWVRRSIRRGVE